MLTHIRPITVDDCLWLRHKVLWPQFPLDYSRVEGDEQAQHFGLFLDDTLISCLSVFTLNVGEYQIRKFATDTDHQHQGHGTKLMRHTLDALESQGTHSISLNARLTASPFYAQFGFQAVGAVYYKEEIAYVVMERHVPPVITRL